LNPKNLIFGVLLVFRVGKTIKIQKTAKKNIDEPPLFVAHVKIKKSGS